MCNINEDPDLSEIEMDDQTAGVISKLHRPLWKTDSTVHLAVTVNIQPTKKMNKKQWRYYSADQQRQILMRIEKFIRTKNPSITLKEMHFEECPVLKQQHFHAWYVMPSDFQTVLETYYNRVCGSSGDQTQPWRHYVAKQVFDQPGWLKYIRKFKTQ